MYLKTDFGYILKNVKLFQGDVVFKKILFETKPNKMYIYKM